MDIEQLFWLLQDIHLQILTNVKQAFYWIDSHVTGKTKDMIRNTF